VAEAVGGAVYDNGAEIPPLPLPTTMEWNLFATVDLDPVIDDGVDLALLLWFDSPLAAGTVGLNFLEWGCPQGDCTFDINSSRFRINNIDIPATATAIEVPAPKPLVLLLSGLLTLMLGRRLSE
jgi:hypothetical protein